MASNAYHRRAVQFSSFILFLTFNLIADPATARAAEGTYPLQADLATFVQSVQNGQAGAVRGVYAEDAFAFPVVQQPSNQAGYVATDAAVVTQFRMAANYGNVGLLAHNHLAGQYFSMLTPGKQVYLVYGGGRYETFTVTQVYRYQALTPNSPHSEFSDLQSGEILTAAQLFKKVYMGARHITFQTCILANGDPSWGRLFIVAEPLPFYPPHEAE